MGRTELPFNIWIQKQGMYCGKLQVFYKMKIKLANGDISHKTTNSPPEYFLVGKDTICSKFTNFQHIPPLETWQYSIIFKENTNTERKIEAITDYLETNSNYTILDINKLDENGVVKLEASVIDNKQEAFQIDLTLSPENTQYNKVNILYPLKKKEVYQYGERYPCIKLPNNTWKMAYF